MNLATIDTTASFSGWLMEARPGFRWEWEHLKYIRRRLNALTEDKTDKIMIMCPPRHGKSEMVTISFAAWWLEQWPEQNVIIGAYNQKLANKFSRKVRKICSGRVPLDSELVDDWETAEGGGLRVVGVGAGVTGMGGDLIVIDDPVKNRKEASSQTYREMVWEWYTDDLYTRLEPGGKLILIMTRWHEDDLAGRILASDDADEWTVIRLPAIAEDDDPLGRDEGEALCPDRYDEGDLAGVRRVLGPSSFAGLFQQSPQEQEGGMFKRSWFQYVDEAPAGVTIRAWDLAATADGGDYIVGVKMTSVSTGGPLPDIYVVDVVREQTDEPLKLMVETAKADGPNVVIYCEQEPGASGKIVARDIYAMLSGYAVDVQPSTGSKVVRAMPFAAAFADGRVYLVSAPWNSVYLNELCAFDKGANDDQVDGSSLGYSKLYGQFEIWT